MKSKTMTKEQNKNVKIKMIEEFYKEHGRLPKVLEKSSEGENIGMFLSHIKQGRTKLTEDQLKRLTVLGFINEPIKNKERTENKIRMVEAFYKEHKRLPKAREQSPEGENLGNFLSNIKQGYTSITEEQKQRLKELGFIVGSAKNKERTENKIRMVEAFFEAHGRLPYQREKSPEGENIGIFLNSIKKGDTKITEDQLSRLKALGFTKKTKKNTSKETKLCIIENFYKTQKRLPKSHEQSSEGENIGNFLNDVKHGKTKITQSQKQRLECLGVDCSKVVIEPNDRQKQLKELKQEKESLLQNYLEGEKVYKKIK